MTASLTPTTFWILTALAGGRRHGFDVMKHIEGLSEGAVSPKVTTLYATLERLARDGLIAPDGDEIVDGRARRYWVITPEGRGGLDRRIAELERAAAAARAQLATPRPALPRTAIA